MSADSGPQLDTSKCYAMSNGEYLGKYVSTESLHDHTAGTTTVFNFETRDVYDADRKLFN
jgi:hypothetical protein